MNEGWEYVNEDIKGTFFVKNKTKQNKKIQKKTKNRTTDLEKRMNSNPKSKKENEDPNADLSNNFDFNSSELNILDRVLLYFVCCVCVCVCVILYLYSYLCFCVFFMFFLHRSWILCKDTQNWSIRFAHIAQTNSQNNCKTNLMYVSVIFLFLFLCLFFFEGLIFFILRFFVKRKHTHSMQHIKQTKQKGIKF